MTSRLGLALAALVVAAGALAPAPARAMHLAPPEGGVHTDTGRCRVGVNKEFHTIQSALDTVDCLYVQIDGTPWSEQLVVRHSLTLAGSTFAQGSNVFTTILQPPADAVGPVTLVKVEGRRVRLKVKHIIFQGPLTSADATGLIGIEMGRDTRLQIRDAFFVNVQPSPLDGRDGFIGIKVGAPSVAGERPQISFADISGTRFEGFQNSAIVFQGTGTTGSIFRTLISAGDPTQNPAQPRTAGQAAPVGIVIMDGANAEITRNDVVDARGPAGGGIGIALSNAGNDTAVVQNNIDRNDIGVAADGITGGTIYRNGLDQNGVGIVLGAASPINDVAVNKNRVEAGGAGIQLVAGTENVLQANNLLSNAAIGLELGAATRANILAKNRAHNNGGLGFLDPTIGSDRKSGTANSWRSNLCHGNNGAGAEASPVRLCILDAR